MHVVIKEAQKAGENTLITVNCPDKTGLGCDLCRREYFNNLFLVYLSRFYFNACAHTVFRL